MLYRHTDRSRLKVVTLDYQAKVIAEIDIRQLATMSNPVLGKMMPDADFDLASIEGDQIKVRSYGSSGEKLGIVDFKAKGATAIVGFGDFNANGATEIIYRTPSGYRALELEPETNSPQYMPVLLDISLQGFDRILGIADLDQDGGSDMVMADSGNRLKFLTFFGRSAKRLSKKTFYPNQAIPGENLSGSYLGVADVDGNESVDLIINPIVSPLSGTAEDPRATIWFMRRLRPKPEVKTINLFGGWRAISVY